MFSSGKKFKKLESKKERNQIGGIKAKPLQIKYNSLGETKLICWSTGPTNSILIKSKKIMLQNFGQLAFF